MKTLNPIFCAKLLMALVILAVPLHETTAKDHEVNVTVNGGHVELTGTVDSWNERLAAEENTFEGGAQSVSNKINIENNPYY